MKTRSIALLLLLAGAAPAMADKTTPAAADEGVFAPKENPLSRYETLRKKSPFEFDPPKIVEPEVINPFEGISLAGYCGNGDTLTVYLLEGKEKKRITVFGDGSPFKKRDSSGFRVIGINRGKSLKTTEIILEKDGRQGPVKFDEDALRSKAPAGGPGVQMVRDQNGNMVPRQVIPKPGGAAAQQTPYQAPQPFIPGQNTPPPQQPPQPNQPNNGAGNNAALPAGSVSNQQLMNHLMGPNGQPAPTTAAPAAGGAQPQNNGGTAVPPPSRRRVVLPTQ